MRSFSAYAIIIKKIEASEEVSIRLLVITCGYDSENGVFPFAVFFKIVKLVFALVLKQREHFCHIARKLITPELVQLQPKHAPLLGGTERAVKAVRAVKQNDVPCAFIGGKLLDPAKARIFEGVSRFFLHLADDRAGK